jgi:hypothetical protein
MIKAIALIFFTVSLGGVASAQPAPPPGAVTNQDTKPVPTPHAMTSKKMHGTKSTKSTKPMPSMKAKPKPKP